jgi:uroporphyrin-III C-methyltransferase
MTHSSNARLILIGAGPGDPELITLKALKALERADVILYDNLVNPKIFDMLTSLQGLRAVGEAGRSNPVLIYAGKHKGESYKQDEINSMILENLAQDKIVVRLKGGDPFIFARGVEELELAQEAGYEVEVIPGLTSGLAVPVMNQITLTHRNKSDTIVFATGHEVNEEKFCLWINALEAGATLLLYMALGNIVEIVEKLSLSLGEDFPIIAIENGSLIDQRIIEANLDSINQKIIDKSFKSPVMFVVGKHIGTHVVTVARLSPFLVK